MLRRLRDRDGQSGFTFVELMVAILILAVLGTVTLTCVVRALQIAEVATQRTNALTDIERALARVTRQIRAADPLLIDPDGTCDASNLSGADCESLVLTRRLDADVYRDGGRATYSYYLVDTGATAELRQDITVTDLATGSATGTSTGSLIVDIASPTTSASLFRFFAVDPADGALSAISCVGIDRDACRSAYATASVVEMTMSRALSQGQPLTISTSVNIRNTRYQP
jgi:prepilin-type N-terminal cleavage/methylation domain-containing protein